MNSLPLSVRMVRMRIHCPTGYCAAMSREGDRRVPNHAESDVHWRLFCCCRYGWGLYAIGLSTRDIRAHLEEVYGLKVSVDLISRVTDAALVKVSHWQNRALEPMYPIIFLDALRVTIRDAESRQVKIRPYTWP